MVASREGRVLALTLEYDGTRYLGFQVQSLGPTVQGEVETALSRLTGRAIRVAGAGRTDSGVHALGQVVSFDWRDELPVSALGRAMNAVLPDDIVVTTAEEKVEGFHARFSARARAYRYTVSNRRERPVVGRQYVHHVPRPLDVAQMAEACGALRGEIDFASFAGRAGEMSTVRRMHEVACERSGDLIFFDFQANAFLPHMVRNIVGTLLQVGSGRIDLAHFHHIIAARDRRAAGPAAPPTGLCLVRVIY